VFISYAREDRPRAEQIARALGAMGLNVFWDTEIPPGKTWADYIEEKLAQSKAMVVLWSANSAGSQWVREEARMGRDSGKLIPVMLDATPAPFGFGEVQAADLSAWRGEANNPNWVRFANAVDAAVRGPNAAPRPVPQAPPRASAFASADTGTAGAEALSPIGYVFKCLRLYVNGNGRARRAELGWFVVFAFIVALIGASIDLSVFGLNTYTGAANSTLFTGLASLAMLCPLIAASSRRAHDFGQSGWLGALMAIPYLNLLALLAFIFIPGQSGENKYGPNPKGV
jgi:uncharacterized membrane protein YhaH (DUF805 family)